MIQILFFLSYYRIEEHTVGENLFTVFTNQGYGFKKNSVLNFEISNSLFHMIFGFATKNEIENIKSLGNNEYYCSKYATLAKYDYPIGSSNTENLTFNIQSKEILYPFSYSCRNYNDFTLSIQITNGKNNLDYRCQTAMIYSLVFSIFYFVIGVSFLIYWLICLRSKIFQFILLLSIIIFFGLEEILFYTYFTKNSDKEYFDSSNSSFYLSTAFIIFKFASILLLSLYNSSSYNPYHKLTKIRESYFIHWAISSIFLIIVIIFVIMNIDSRLTRFFVPSVFYVLFLISQAMLPNPFSITKITNIFYSLANYFTFSMNSCYIHEMKAKINAYMIIIDMNLASIIIQVITLSLLLFDFIYSNSKAKIGDENDKDINKNENSDQSFSSDISK